MIFGIFLSMEFETKKIRIETLGEYLVEVRERLGLSVEDVSANLGMKQKLLEGLESGNFKSLPPDVYVVGFLKKLGRLYAVDADVLIAQYRKERDIAVQLRKQEGARAASLQKLYENVVITPKFLTLLLGGLFVAATIAYVVWQVFSINKYPSLEIVEPKDRQLVQQSSVTVAGKTDPGMTVTINDQNVFVDSEGNFKTQLGITPGPKELVFTAKNKFDKSVAKTVTIIGEEAVQPEAQVTLRVELTDRVKLDYSIDDGAPVSESLDAGTTKVLTAAKKVLLSTSNAGATKLTYNSQDLGFLGRPGERLTGIPFSAESATMNRGDN